MRAPTPARTLVAGKKEASLWTVSRVMPLAVLATQCLGETKRTCADYRWEVLFKSFIRTWSCSFQQFEIFTRGLVI